MLRFCFYFVADSFTCCFCCWCLCCLLFLFIAACCCDDLHIGIRYGVILVSLMDILIPTIAINIFSNGYPWVITTYYRNKIWGWFWFPIYGYFDTHNNQVTIFSNGYPWVNTGKNIYCNVLYGDRIPKSSPRCTSPCHSTTRGCPGRLRMVRMPSVRLRMVWMVAWNWCFFFRGL